MTDETLSADAASAALRPRRTRTRNRGIAIFIRDIVIIFLVALLVSFLIKTFLIRSFYIPSSSMEDTLQVNDRIIVNELVPDMVPLERGDVVVFTDPGGWLGPQIKEDVPPVVAAWDGLLSLVGLSTTDSNDHLIKRVIGLPGDHIVCCNALGQMTVNGVPLDEPYVKLPPGTEKVSSVPFDVVVPEGSLWVMGDNRYNSEDSRFQTNKPTKGFVPIENVVGKAFVISWPIGHWTWLDNYPDTFGGVPPPDESD